VGLMVPLMVVFFGWSMALENILTMKNLWKWHDIVVDWCCLCKWNGVSVGHFLLHCEVAYAIWNVTNNWSTSFSICNRVSITCGSSHNRVIALNLSYMDLIGTIPPHVGNLSFHFSLNIENNSFHGSIPNKLSHLYRLQHLFFGFNNLSETIPLGMGLLSKLQRLFLYGNKFSRTTPPSLSNISLLQIIDLSQNQLSGSIPSSIFNIYNLQETDLRDNMLSGPMPSIISNM
jgi:LRR receptor-like serine/threonine-protein kinase FLS2